MRDVIVIGGGPAGSCVAKYAGREKDVVLLEKGSSPSSICGGGLTKAMVERIKPDFPKDSVLQETKRIEVKIGEISFEQDVENLGFDYLLKVVDREKFDKTLLENAGKNSEIILETQAESIEKNKNHWKVHTEENTFKTRIVVLADGAPSLLARSVGIDTVLDAYDVSSCILDTINQDSGTLKLFIDDRYVKVGYAGILPAGNMCKVGVYEEALKNTDLREKADLLKKDENIQKKTKKRIIGMIPSSKPLDSLVPKNNLALVGDAGRLCRPFIGAGIDMAVASGRILGKIIAAGKSLEDYDEEMVGLKEKVNWFYSLKNKIWEKGQDKGNLIKLLSETFFKHYQNILS